MQREDKDKNLRYSAHSFIVIPIMKELPSPVHIDQHEKRVLLQKVKNIRTSDRNQWSSWREPTQVVFPPLRL